MLHAVGTFDPSFNGHQPGFEEFAPLPLGHVLPDHRVDQAVLVFEGDESDAAGGLRPLPHGDQAGEADTLAMRQVAQFRGAFEATRAQLLAQQAQRMPAQAESGHGVIGMHILGRARQRQGHRGFGRGTDGIEQGALRFHARHGPARLVAMACQPAQGRGIGQDAAQALVQVRALAQVGDIVEGLPCAGLLDAQCRVFPEAVDQAQSKAQGRLRCRIDGDRFQRAVPVAVAHIDRTHLDAVAPRVLHDLAG